MLVNKLFIISNNNNYYYNIFLKTLVAVSRARIFAGALSRGSARRRRTPRLNKQAALVPMSLFLLGISANWSPAEPEPEPAVPLQTGEIPHVRSLPPLLGVVRVCERWFPEFASLSCCFLLSFGWSPCSLCSDRWGSVLEGVWVPASGPRTATRSSSSVILAPSRTFVKQLLLRKYIK